MRTRQLLISDSGYVYERLCRPGQGPRRLGKKRMLGHISTLLNERGSRAVTIRGWWKSYLKRIGSSRNTSQQL
jgi:hypothetical protein